MTPSTTLRWAPRPCAPLRPSSGDAWGPLLVLGTPELTKESSVALERRAPSMSVFNGPSQEAVWECTVMATSRRCGRWLSGKTLSRPSGSRSKLDLNCSSLHLRSDEGSRPRVSGGLKGDGFACSVCPWAAQAEQ